MQAVYDSKPQCSGCAACKDLCPKNAITMQADEEGFLYPVIDQKACIDCGICRKNCPLHKENHYKHPTEPTFWATKHNSPDILKSSTSGGAFTALSDAILSLDSSIYGVILDKEFKARHSRATTNAERDQMRFSKYVQSDLGDIAKQIDSDLKSGMTVLFTGTPCQTAGMQARFATKAYNKNLFLCDLICHSVPSPLIWEEYKALLAEENSARLTHVQFRSKKHSWLRANSNKGFLYSVAGDDTLHEDPRFFDMFIRYNYIVRPSCYSCCFSDTKRTSDITIADYWGIEDFAPNLYDPLGVSVVLVNTAKGNQLLDMAQNSLISEQRPAQESITHQKRLSPLAGTPPEKREEFWAYYRKHGLAKAIEKFHVRKPHN